MRVLLVAAVGMVVLSGCDAGSDSRQAPAPVASEAAAENAVDNTAAPDANVAAAVVAMSDAQRRGVLARAIIDADLRCDGVIKAERMEDAKGGLPVWRASCKNGQQHIVTITPDGTAQLVSRADNH